MTIIVATSWGEQTVIGCDQVGTDGWGVQGEHGTKLYKAPFGWVGFTASYRTLQVVHRRLRSVEKIRGEEDMEILVTQIASGLQDAGWDRSSSSGLPTCDSLSLLLATFEGDLWTIQSDLAYLRHHRFAAIGSGYQVALGAMHASHSSGLTAQMGANRGLAAACDVIASCAHPAPLQIVRHSD